MGKSRVYWGCEMQSPLYRQIASEMQAKKTDKIVKQYRTKRGKQSSLLHTINN